MSFCSMNRPQGQGVLPRLEFNKKRVHVLKDYFLACQRAIPIDIKRRKNRLLKFCYAPVTSASLPRVSFFFSFFWGGWVNEPHPCQYRQES